MLKSSIKVPNPPVNKDDLPFWSSQLASVLQQLERDVTLWQSDLILSGAYSAMPAANGSGRFFYDETNGDVYFDAGTWIKLTDYIDINYTCSTRAEIDAALTVIGSNQATIFITPATTVTVSATNLTIPSNVRLSIPCGSLISVSAGITLAINGPLDAGLYQIFATTGTITGLKSAVPEWWGAVGNDSADDITALQKCSDSSKLTFLTDGKTYKITTALYPPEGHIIHSFGPSAVIHRSTTTGYGIQPYNYVTLRNFTLRGAGGSYVGGSDGITILYDNSGWVDPGGVVARDYTNMAKWRGAHFVVENLVIENWSANGMGAGPYSIIENVTSQNNTNEGMLLAGAFTKIINPSISNCKGWGIDINTSYVDVLGGRIFNCGDEDYYSGDMGGIIITSYTHTAGAVGNKIIGTTIDTSDGPGVFVYANSAGDYPLTDTHLLGLVIKNVNIDAAVNSGAITILDLTTSGNKLDRVIINGVTINTTTYGNGINVWSARNVSIDNYHIKSVPGAGIEIYAMSGAWQSVTIGKGTIRNFGTYGILAYGGSKLVISDGYDILELGVTRSANFFGIFIQNVVQFSVGKGFIDLDDLTYAYALYLTGTTGHGGVSGAVISNCLAAIYDNSTGDYISKSGNDLSNNNTYPLTELGTRTNCRSFNNIGVAVPAYAGNTAAKTGGMSNGEIYQITATDYAAVVHA